MNRLAPLRAALLNAMACTALAGCTEGSGNAAATPALGGAEDRTSEVASLPVPGLGATPAGGGKTNEPDPETDPEAGPTTGARPAKTPFDVEVQPEEPDVTRPDSTDPEADPMSNGVAADNGDGSAGRKGSDVPPPTHAPDGTPYCD